MVVYHRNPRMHTLGNHGVGGLFHALLAPLATSLITRAAYGGWEPRVWLASQVRGNNGTVVDLGCGVGISTVDVGVDASAEMLRVARFCKPEARFEQGCAETWGETDAYGAATLTFVTHEMPRRARRAALRNAVRISRGPVCVMDVCPSYSPSWGMLVGEPYLLEYQKHMDRDVADVARMTHRRLARRELVPGHVVLWTLDDPGEDDWVLTV